MPAWKSCCQFKNITNLKRCCRKYVQIVNGRNYCTQHLKCHFTIHAKLIQHRFRYFIINKAINIYKLLPRDLQLHILFYMQEPYLLKIHHYNNINTIILNKIIRFDTINKNIINKDIWLTTKNRDDAIDLIIKNMLYVTYIVTKYHQILNYEVHNMYCKLFCIILYSNTYHQIYWIKNESYNKLISAQTAYYNMNYTNLKQSIYPKS